MHIMIVDDNADDRKLLRYNLEHHGCEVTEAKNGLEGLELARSRRPDIIISDVLMPAMDGFEFLRRMKHDDDLKSIPFVFYSAVYTGQQEVELAISLGAVDFVIKPKEPEEFWKDIQNVIGECRELPSRPLEPVLIDSEEEYLRNYCSVIAAKLEDKVRELESAKLKIGKSEQRYRNLFNSLRDVVIVADEGRIIIDVNQPALRTTFGYELDEVIGRSTRLYYADQAGFELAGREIFDHQRALEGKIINVALRRKSGATFRGEMYALKLMDDDGRPTGNIAVIRDITEKEKLETQLQQSQKMEAVGQLAGGVAHDFNNILTAIIGYATLLQRSVDRDDPGRVNLDQILSASERAARLTHSLLAFSRKQVLNPQPLDLAATVRNLEQLLSRLISEDIELRTIASPEPIVIMADAGQIGQVLMNLATNARDAMPDGGTLTIEIGKTDLDDAYVRAHAVDAAGPYAVVRVSDTGAGMDANIRDKIFEPFFTTKEQGKGSGLGLAIVYGIVKQHRGHITVYSEPGKGALFTMYLPLIDSESRSEATAEPTEALAGTETVLLAEDDEMARNITRTVLTEFGYTVIEAVDGEDAVRKLADHAGGIDLAVLDMIMPKKNGREVLRELRRSRPDTKVLFMSGYPADIMQRWEMLERNTPFVPKPVSPTMLLKKVREVLDS